MSNTKEAVRHRRADEEPDFGDPDYIAHSDPYGSRELNAEQMDEQFDEMFPDEAERIKKAEAEANRTHPVHSHRV